ncbi:MAG: DNA mismatch repair protein MutS [Oligoflexia bacterium]|nr:DNA mismatch repair protein MutS [Oligoflexia bacterium]
MLLAKGMLQEIIDSKVKLTPMISQYIEIKKKHPDILLFFRMGDFYELFFDDAKEASRILNITLTHRGKIGTVDIPMAGIPFHAANNYVEKVIALGKKVAICEQVEDPKLAKGIVRREVTQIVSPGMPFDLEKGDAKEHRYMAAIYSYVFGIADGVASDITVFYLVLLDFTTGDFVGYKLLSQEQVIDKLNLYSPKELVLFPRQWDGFKQLNNFIKEGAFLKSYLDKAYFSIENSKVYVEKLIPSYSRDRIISMDSHVLSPISALAFYVSTNQNIEEYVHIRPFRMEAQEGKMRVSMSTLCGLEIFPKGRDRDRDKKDFSQSFAQSLLGFMDRTMTAMGAREIKNFFLAPSSSLSEILERQRLIAHLLEQERGIKKIREELSLVRDLERILAKISSKKVTSQDLLNLANAILIYKKFLVDTDIKVLLDKMMNSDAGTEAEASDSFFDGQLSLNLEGYRVLSLLVDDDFDQLKTVATKIISSINDEIGATLEKGNLIKRGASEERDRLFDLSNHTEEALLRMEVEYRKKSQISNLKVKYNNIFGYFIEVSKSHLSKVPANFERRQTLVNAERFVTKELLDFEKEIFSAREKLEKIEREIFNNVVCDVSTVAAAIRMLARFFATLDVLQSLAWVSLQENFKRPKIITDKDKKILNVKGGWHPLIKSVLKERFVSHDLYLDEHCYFGLITGPNMAGKTTVMREMAIIQFLTQIGSFVPASFAEVSICDYLFSRVGASDDIMKGHSTFMVEMSETAEILRHASAKSFIVIDEVGRGTSTYDGLSIAWALVEHLVLKVKALTLFSTHYHELVAVVDGLKCSKNLSVETAIQGGNVKFLYRLLERGAEQSYGIYVAKLAGLPRSLLFKAEEILKHLEGNKKESTKENQKNHQHNKDLLNDSENIINQKTSLSSDEKQRPTLFEINDQEVHDHNARSFESKMFRELKNDLERVNIMNMTPIEAMDRLFKLQQKVLLQ